MWRVVNIIVEHVFKFYYVEGKNTLFFCIIMICYKFYNASSKKSSLSSLEDKQTMLYLCEHTYCFIKSNKNILDQDPTSELDYLVAIIF